MSKTRYFRNRQEQLRDSAKQIERDKAKALAELRAAYMLGVHDERIRMASTKPIKDWEDMLLEE